MDRRAAQQSVEEILDEAVALHQAVRGGSLDALLDAAETIAAACASGGKVLAFGNGGSAADAQHFAAELVGRFERNRPGIAAVALTTDTSILTSIANDVGFERVFARQIEALGRPGDVVLAISTSGGSPSVLTGAREARGRGMKVVALTGRDGGALGALADVHVNVAHASTARVQEVHCTLLHAICRIVEGRG